MTDSHVIRVKKVDTTGHLEALEVHVDMNSGTTCKIDLARDRLLRL